MKIVENWKFSKISKRFLKISKFSFLEKWKSSITAFFFFFQEFLRRNTIITSQTQLSIYTRSSPTIPKIYPRRYPITIFNDSRGQHYSTYDVHHSLKLLHVISKRREPPRKPPRLRRTKGFKRESAISPKRETDRLSRLRFSIWSKNVRALFSCCSCSRPRSGNGRIAKIRLYVHGKGRGTGGLTARYDRTNLFGRSANGRPATPLSPCLRG